MKKNIKKLTNAAKLAWKAIVAFIQIVGNKLKTWSIFNENSTIRSTHHSDYKQDSHNEMDNNIKIKDKDKRKRMEGNILITNKWGIPPSHK